VEWLTEPLGWWLWGRFAEQRRVKPMLARRALVVVSEETKEAQRWSLEQQAAYWGEPCYREDLQPARASAPE